MAQPYVWHSKEFQLLIGAAPALPHALLLKGPRGTGKLVFARAVAQSILCEARRADGAACGECAACGWFSTGNHPDYRQIEPLAAGGEQGEEEGKKSLVISVDQIRTLPDFLNVSSHRGGVRVVVIHPAEALNVNAANALLKNLEEPPPSTHFILVTHRPRHLLPTITSRCGQVALPPPARAVATQWLCEQGMREPDLALAHMGNAPLLAVEANESDYWGARTAFLRQLTRREIDVLSGADAAQDCPLPPVIAWLQKWSYDIAHYQSTGRVRYNPDCVEDIARLAASCDALRVLRFHRDMVQLQRDANHPLNPRLFIETVLMAYSELVHPVAAAA